MRKYELIPISLIIVVLLLRAFPSIEPLTKVNFTTFLLWMTGVIYFAGTIWFMRKENKNIRLLSFIAGMAFFSSFYVMPSLFHFEIYERNQFFLFPDFSLFIILGIFIGIKRNSEVSKGPVRWIFLRAVILAFITAFLYYIPPSNSMYRGVMTFLNNGDKHLAYHLKMIDFEEKFSVSYKDGDCAGAAVYAEKATKSGKLWSGIDTTDNYLILKDMRGRYFLATSHTPDSIIGLIKVDTSAIDSVNPLSGNFKALYDAYKCMAENKFHKNEFSDALLQYKKACNAIYYGAYDTANYFECINWLNERIAICYSKQRDFQRADSLFVKVMKQFHILPHKNDNDYAEILKEYALSLTEQHEYSASNQYLRQSIPLYEKDTVKNAERIIHSYYFIAGNCIEQDSLESAIDNVKKVINKLPSTNIYYCAANLYYGICLYKSDKFHEAETTLNKALNCLNSINSSGMDAAGAYDDLTYVKMALGDFIDAREDINKAIQIASKNSRDGDIGSDYIIALAYLDMKEGKYSEAEKYYKSILTKPHPEKGITGKVKVELSQLYFITGRMEEAKTLSYEALSDLGSTLAEKRISNTDYINEMAFVRYCLGDYECADSLYHYVIELCKSYKQENSSHYTMALNGLGLLNTAWKNYRKADTFYKQSLELHIKIYGPYNPYTALVYLNYGTLKTYEGDYATAERMLKQALKIDISFLDKTHDIFGDICTQVGNLDMKKNNKQDARLNYETALGVYLDKFGKNHYKVLALEKILKNLQ